MLLRLHFSVQDLARVTVEPGPDPLWEATLGLQQLTSTARRAEVRRARALVDKRAAGAPVRLLCALVPSTGYYPDFLTPPDTATGLTAGLDAVRGTPVAALEREVRQVVTSAAPHRDSAPWLRGLMHGDRERLTDLTSALRSVHDVLTEVGGELAEELLDADRRRRTEALREGGVHALLRSLAPIARWQPPVLHVNYPVDRDIDLAGRGLRLIPSYFCRRMPISLADPELQPVLVYPVERAGPLRTSTGPLHELLGRTRANVLAAVRATATTGEIAVLLRVSPASVSEHVHVLTSAGLVRSQRAGNQVLHTLTPLGAAVLNGALPRFAR